MELKLSFTEITESNFENEINHILELQKIIANELQKLFKGNELFFTNTKEEFLDELKLNGIFLRFYEENNTNNTIGYGLASSNMKYYTGTTIDPLPDGCCQIDIVAVNPKYRNQKIGSYILNKLCDIYLERYESIKTILTTVSPYNRASLRMFLKNGYYINGLFKKHGKYYRTILRKDLN